MLQSPQMQQLRQRVIASCHVGPMDEEDTRAYVEHRMRLVGWKDDPRFDPDVFEAIYAFSGGIPRRINTMCDRLLLSGFLSGKHTFSGPDASAVVAEIRDEVHSTPAAGGQAQQVDAAGSGPNGADRYANLPNIADLKLDPETAAKAANFLAGLRAGQVEERLARMEKSVSVMLGLMHQIVDAASRKKD
jgi:hypothetical protein